MASQTEKLLSRKSNRRGLLVPLLEDFMLRPMRVESKTDADFIYTLVMKQIERERRRSLNGVFSPSSLAACVRQVYLAKHHENLGIKRIRQLRVEPNYYFLTGEWLHLKWQWALFRMNQTLPDEVFKLYGTEVPVTSKHGDHGGTIDVIAAINGEYMPIDFKGINVRAFGKIARGDVPLDYRIQLADYILLANSDRSLKIPKMERGLLISENKGGPDNNHPIALHESEIWLKDSRPELRARLEVLRTHEKENSIPAPECQSTKGIQFLGCPFSKYCKKEVAAIEKQKAAQGGNSKRYSVSVPEKRRSDRPRRGKPGR